MFLSIESTKPERRAIFWASESSIPIVTRQTFLTDEHSSVDSLKTYRGRLENFEYYLLYKEKFSQKSVRNPRNLPAYFTRSIQIVMN